MKKLYYHPERIKMVNGPCIIDQSKYDAVVYFIQLIEQLAPEVLLDLEQQVYEIYAQAMISFENMPLLTVLESPCEWNVVSKSDKDSFPLYLDLQKAINQWASRYNLLGDFDFYEQLALWSIANFHDDCQEESRLNRKDEIEKFAKERGIPVESCRTAHIYKNSWPYEEKLSLSDNLFFEYEEDDLELSKSIGKKEPITHSFFSRLLPFVFSPDRYSRFTNDSREASDFESIWLHDFTRTRLIEQGKMQEYKEIFTRQWNEGTGWDPREETWSEFESRMDKNFERYKKSYRRRTEQFLQNRGYQIAKEKRNLLHFEWLVRFQVQGWSLRKIADFYSNKSDELVHEDNVFQGIKSTAEHVLINLRSRK